MAGYPLPLQLTGIRSASATTRATATTTDATTKQLTSTKETTNEATTAALLPWTPTQQTDDSVPPHQPLVRHVRHLPPLLIVGTHQASLSHEALILVNAFNTLTFDILYCSKFTILQSTLDSES